MYVFDLMVFTYQLKNKLTVTAKFSICRIWHGYSINIVDVNKISKVDFSDRVLLTDENIGSLVIKIFI